MLQASVSRAFIDHTSIDATITPSTAPFLYQPIERHLFGVPTFHPDPRIQEELFHLIVNNILSSSSLGITLRKTLY